MTLLFPSEISVEPIPTEEMTRALAEGGTCIENCPFSSVDVPKLVPFTITEAFAMGVPFASFICPVTGEVWARATAIDSNSTVNKDKNFLMCDFLISAVNIANLSLTKFCVKCYKRLSFNISDNQSLTNAATNYRLMVN